MNKINFNHVLASFAIRLNLNRNFIEDDLDKKDLNGIIKAKEYLGKLYEKSFKDGVVKARDMPNSIKQYLGKKETLVICCNYDPVFWELKNEIGEYHIKNIIQLHGSCYNPATIIFPCEYLMNYSSNYQNKKNHLTTPDIPDDDLTCLMSNHYISLNALQNNTKLKKIFFWGLSINDYDAEIMAMLETTLRRYQFFKEPQPKMWIINPDINAAYRTSFFTGIFEFQYVDPTNSSRDQKITI